MLGAVTWGRTRRPRETWESRLPAAPAKEGSRYLEGHDVGTGTIAVDFIHGTLQGHSLLGEALQVI